MYRLPLFDHCVIDLLDGTGALVGRILGDMGAEVIKLETGDGDSLRGSEVIAALNVNKYGFRADAAEVPVVTLQLAARADVFVAPTGAADPAALRAANDGLIVVLLPPDAGPAACIAAAGAVGLALWDRRRTGRGGVIEVASLSDCAGVTAPPPTTEPVSSHSGHGTAPSSPLHLSETPLHIRLPAPTLGEHNEYVRAHLLGTPADAH
jgi:crotonobetainyl-CoA:carnitine CoA-transferase CaiB-like acyl-CoA transferase